MGEAADLAIALSAGIEIEEGKGVGVPATRGNPEVLEQVRTHQVRGLPQGGTHTQIDARLPKINGVELGVGVGDVQQAHVTIAATLVERLALTRLSRGPGRPRQQPGHSAQGQQAGKFSPG